MITYVAFLRGINVSGQKKIKMTSLQLMFQDIGFKDVITYIQSGNVVFKTDAKIAISSLEKKIEDTILNRYNFNVSVIVKTKETIETIFIKNPYAKEVATNQIYFVFLKGSLDNVLMDSLMQETYKNESFIIINSCIYLNCKQGYGKAKCNNNFFERKLKVTATTRNFKTMNKMLELAKG